MDHRPDCHRFVGRTFCSGLIAVYLLLDVAALNATTFVTLSLKSNILVDGGRVIFKQGTGSITILDRDSGAVLSRKNVDVGSSAYCRFLNSAHGIVKLTGDRITLLDRDTLVPVWQVDRAGDAVIEGDYIVSHNGEHLSRVTCRSIRSGAHCWQFDMEDGWRFVAANGKVVIFTPHFSDRRANLLVLDLEKGHTLFRHEAPIGIRWQHVFFDGDRLYLLPAEERDSPGGNAKPRSMTTLDLDGNVLAEVDVSPPDFIFHGRRSWDRDASFIWDDKYFGVDGHVRKVTLRERKVFAELALRDDCFLEILPSALFADYRMRDAESAAENVLETLTPNQSWKAYASYLQKRSGDVLQACVADGKLILGSSEGHVECFDLETGRSRWIYVFPVIRVIGSHTPGYGSLPYLTEQAAQYQANAAKFGVTCGSIPLGREFDPSVGRWAELRSAAVYSGTIVVDPSPDDPFCDLGRYYYWLVLCALLPAVDAAIVFTRLGKRIIQSSPLFRTPAIPSLRFVVWSLVLSVPPAFGLLEYGLVSHAWTLALKGIFVAAIISAAYGAVQLFVANRWATAFLSSLVVIGWCAYMLNPLWYA